MSEKFETNFGFIKFQQVDDFADIHNIEIKLKYRSKGHGGKLLELFLHKMKSRGVTEITLEVRRDNNVAINLYEKFGFECVAVRTSYYEDGCDGLLMRLGI